MVRVLFYILVIVSLVSGQVCDGPPSETTKNGIKQCSGDMIFEESFDEIDPSVWTTTIQFSSEDHDAVIYEDDSDTLFTSNGILNIGQKLLDESTVREGTISLSRCTGPPSDCTRTAQFFNILPGVLSSQICTKKSFKFKYGTVQIRAKLPSGDWVTPQIWLKPVQDSYGPGYKSGKIKIAMARGNKELKTSSGEEIGSTLAVSSVLVRDEDKIKSRSVLARANQPWSSKFHNYTLIWKPNDISFSYEDDGSKAVSLINGEGKLAQLMELTRNDLEGRISPFDKEFYLCLGLSAASYYDFPDDSTSDGDKKPWNNFDVKGLLHFWTAKDKWYSTWSSNTKLLIDSIEVRAL